jgi:hypothetical protein
MPTAGIKNDLLRLPEHWNAAGALGSSLPSDDLHDGVFAESHVCGRSGDRADLRRVAVGRWEHWPTRSVARRTVMLCGITTLLLIDYGQGFQT